ncbi:DNA alkylation repair protein [Euzebya tangerina]|uniref:DNA alkylation repair protein n=1 Tax=Euzebya tangerina TaxID=591198 RepID=UPI000E3151A9|nr:DNA alkylation repair protein [Euzebya tangerina]
MAEPLKNSFGIPVVREIATMIDDAASRASVPFDPDAFTEAAGAGFDDLELTPRARQVAAVMADHLPADRAVALAVLEDSFGPPLAETGEEGMAPFRYLPFVFFVADHGHDHLEAALAFQKAVTTRFTAEFSIRSYLEGPHRDATLARLRRWAGDPDEHVRRLVSEGSRPRLPWAPRLRSFIEDPAPVLALLEELRHDPSEYVRRSVANNLNDIAKDHPDTVVAVAQRWWSDIDHRAARAGDQQALRERWMIRHALRTLIKQGDADALAVLGFHAASPIAIATAEVAPSELVIGEAVDIRVTLHNPSDQPGAGLLDLRLHFVKADGRTSPKVFKGAEVELDPGEERTVRKRVRLNQQSTRTHYPGTHQIDALLNGVATEIGAFELRQP